jgi:hypothetical protein
MWSFSEKNGEQLFICEKSDYPNFLTFHTFFNAGWLPAPDSSVKMMRGRESKHRLMSYFDSSNETT